MIRCQRGPAPELLARDGEQIGRDFAASRIKDPTYRFQWRARLYNVTRAALAEMTNDRCSYCDGHPISAMGTESIDHFRPKGNPEFHTLVCIWENLFLCCTACNHSKREQWQEQLLKPDVEGYRFERYFAYRTDTGELSPNLTASDADQARAQVTIEILGLNRVGLCVERKKTARLLQLSQSDDDRRDLGYRYLVPLCVEPSPS